MALKRKSIARAGDGREERGKESEKGMVLRDRSSGEIRVKY